MINFEFVYYTKKMRKFSLIITIVLLVSSACKKNSNPIIITYPATISNLEVTTFSVHAFLADNGGLELNYRGFCVGSTENPTVAFPENIEYSPTGFQSSQFSSVIRVQFDSTYHVRAFVKTGNSGDSIFYGNDVAFTVSGEYSGEDTLKDGTVFHWVRIGDRTWMSENLSYLPAVSGPKAGSDQVPFYYVYNYDGNNTAEAKERAVESKSMVS